MFLNFFFVYIGELVDICIVGLLLYDKKVWMVVCVFMNLDGLMCCLDGFVGEWELGVGICGVIELVWCYKCIVDVRLCVVD